MEQKAAEQKKLNDTEKSESEDEPKPKTPTKKELVKKELVKKEPVSDKKDVTDDKKNIKTENESEYYTFNNSIYFPPIFALANCLNTLLLLLTFDHQ
jgi:glucan-binding YG repeat protein